MAGENPLITERDAILARIAAAKGAEQDTMRREFAQRLAHIEARLPKQPEQPEQAPPPKT